MYNLQGIAVTTSQPREHLINIAQNISAEIKVKYIPRNNQSIKKVRLLNNIEYLIIVREDRIQISAENEFFFHPGMSIPRIKALKKGELDAMITAMGLEPGERVLDCTLGLANDAIVASYTVGSQGVVLGIESSPLIYIITKYGLSTYNKGSKAAQEAMGNINVVWNNYDNYLRRLKDNSFDVVYFDPMFQSPIMKSSGINNLRSMANYQQLTTNTIEGALRVAQKRVVIKNRKDSKIFSDLHVDKIEGGKYSPIAFGIYYK